MEKMKFFDKNKSDMIKKITCCVFAYLPKLLCNKKNQGYKTLENSGEPAVYDTHQEIIIELWKGWA